MECMREDLDLGLECWEGILLGRWLGATCNENVFHMLDGMMNNKFQKYIRFSIQMYHNIRGKKIYYLRIL
jgi:hypothetical protein